ncbi:hypothetical protein GCM10020221_02400 [Streptomyces thioluteus]|uniref:Uncharacterized protein n=2 Tax=Streptomyces thioluteus TaxID=66431 RepID=A0ABN3WDV9_STRTU
MNTGPGCRSAWVQISMDTMSRTTKVATQCGEGTAAIDHWGYNIGGSSRKYIYIREGDKDTKTCGTQARP